VIKKNVGRGERDRMGKCRLTTLANVNGKLAKSICRKIFEG